ncbi:uncharacterized protein NECHADRAFT_49776 [Fusarium vanettenii 77-13-4]|uniref:ABC transporter n=1 Tax=Fusarium vanettenii (strain ATCC MYA-4622 / CBS 123669 / FGSC 9596 / NRRL 45880 / 77-13-4) TaxID=660122 RepID=C7ZJ19_FUSV7|nr:uncharacterized protein NECHADRAFT_49776 [Fusarium vanettenii 77-13-4]EEU35999.1 hypothetical protein NECHADRAFT_49776 [Fusarium vanettenii 77-13-4]
MHTQQLTQIHFGPKPHDYEPVTQNKVETSAYALEEAKLQDTLLKLCPANLWHNGSYSSGCPRPILVGKHHQQQMQDLHEALTIAITDIVQRWWTDRDARFPERMPLEKEEEEILRWVDGQVSCGNIAPFSECLGSWRPDFLVDEDEQREENYRITEINARFSFNGFLHEAYGQEALNRSLPEGPGGLVGATNPDMILDGLFGLFQPQYPLHLLKGAEHGIDIHMFIDAVWRRFGIKPRLITPADLRLFPDPRSKSGYRLCCIVKNRGDFGSSTNSWIFTTNGGEIWEEIHQVGLELHQRELVALEPEMWRQLSLRCFNDMRTVLLVHDKRMLGIVKDEIPHLVARMVLTPSQAEALASGVVDTILPGSRRLHDLLELSRASPRLRHDYILKPIRSGKGDGIVFGDDVDADEWVAALEGLVSPKVVPGITCVVQRRIRPRLYDLALKASVGMVRYPLVGTYHVANGKLLGLGTWRASSGRIVALDSRLPIDVSTKLFTMNQHLAVPLSCAALAITVLTTIAALTSVFRQLRSGKPKDRFYDDRDGCATPQSLAAFSTKGIKALILLFSAFGAGTSAASLILSSLHSDDDELILENALRTATWQHKNLSSLLWIISTIVAVGLALSCGILPRRPHVFYDNRKVDAQWTVSTLSRYTWTWVQPLLLHAALHNDINLEDVPQPDSRMRSQALKSAWDRLDKTFSLIKSLFGAYKGKLAILWAVTLVRCAVSIGPFWFMLRTLNILEHQVIGSHNMELMALILGMSISNLLDSWMEGWSYWFSLSDLALPVRTQISGLIFDKALRRKNIRSVQQEDRDSEEEDSDSSEDVVALKSHQSIVNLVGVDTERIFYFVQYHFLILTGMVKLVIFSAFLLKLLGWIPFLAGILAWASTLPANTWFSKRVLAESRSLMKLRDTKLSRISEVLLGMRQIKFGALESQWEQRILALRETELKTLWKFFLADSGLFACWVISPILLAVALLSAYVLIHGSLLPSIAFVSIGIFNTLETTLGSLPELFTLGLDSLVSLRRIDAYLHEPERQCNLADGPSISFEGASISWPVEDMAGGDEIFAMHDLDFTFPNGALSVISGKVGSGKTLLLSAILGEAELLKGTICVPKAQYAYPDKWIIPGSVAYVSQTAWLENDSLRNNILFGLPFEQARYDTVIKVCALEADLAVLTDGDSTDLGANGVNLSGGQKWRVALARAVYSQAEILIMEDIFSAVDAHVGAWIFEKCLTGDICQGRTRILVTHHLGLVLPAASFVVELSGGIVTYSGPPKGSVCSIHSCQSQSGEGLAETELVDHLEPVRPMSSARAADDQSPESSSPTPKKFMQEETREKGTVKGSVYLTYVKSSGGVLLWAGCVGVYLAYQAGVIGRAWWLRIWTGQASSETLSGSFYGQSIYNSVVSTHQLLSQPSTQATLQSDVFFYLKIYVAISMGTVIIGILRYISSYFLAVRASRSIFQQMLFKVMRVPMLWLDTVPTGRVLNRFTADFNIIDERIAMTWSMFFSSLLRLLGICIASCFASAYLVPPAILLLGLGIIVGRKYLVASRPLKRLESNAKSPIFELFNTTLAGISTIRAFRRTHTYLLQMHRNLDAWVMTSFYIALANRWMSFRMALIAALFSIAVGTVIIVKPIDAALAGLALSFILDFSESLRWTIRCYGDMELGMNSMERVLEYMTLETEPQDGEKPPAAWPTSGAIDMRDLEVSYAPGLPPVLKSLSLQIGSHERVGVVGRTGAGKSSLTLALFRFLEARSGSISIDGVDISKIPLSDLRSRLSIIPQHPVLFSGTIRSNLDPFGQLTDVQLYEALARVGLINPASSNNSNIFRDLSSPVSESGGNLSQGQQQLLCIARSLIANSKIVVLDEATSAIDVATDTLIQRNIREWFTDRTLVVIAHRLSTVVDFDRILVLENGVLVENGSPRELWERDGTFRSMCNSTGASESERLRKVIMG